MDAPTGEQPMDVLGATNTLHRVSTEHLLPHRPAVTCVFPSARAREPFYATFSFVSRCHAASVCGSRPRATRIRVCMCAYARVRAVRASVHLPPPPPHPFVHPDDDGGGGGGGDARELRALTRRVCFIRDFSNPLLRFFARVSPPPSSSSLPFSIHPYLIFVFLFSVFLTVSLAIQPAHFRLSLSSSQTTHLLSDFRTLLYIYRTRRRVAKKHESERA